MHESNIQDYSSYIPIKNAVKKLKLWKEKGIEILYLTSRTKPKEIQQIKNVLKKHNFPQGKLFFRRGEEYKNVVERIKPDVFIDDDCKSIGGNDIKKLIDPKLNIKIIIVKEFGGINNLPDNPSELFEVNS
ncbi:MAG: hypothetical protein GTN36_03865 [Candidatus Aenigmarchaeota archaeon]|nr:hypothetical protein [Candidatus Aenigmarchaeota archaeon]